MAGIIRIKKTTDFVVMAKYHLNDKRLSWRAKGLMSYLLGLPDDWQINISDLKTRSKDKRDGTTGAVNELLKFGYMSRIKSRNNKGYFEGYNYNVNEKPNLTVNGNTVNGNTVNGNTVNGNTVNGNTVTTKYPIELNNKLELNNKENNVVQPNGADDALDHKQKLFSSIDVLTQQAVEVLKYWNEITGQNRGVENGHGADHNQKLVKNWLKKKYTVQQIKDVIWLKTKHWLGCEENEQYLRPKTVFSSNFISYQEMFSHLCSNEQRMKNQLKVWEKRKKFTTSAKSTANGEIIINDKYDVL